MKETKLIWLPLVGLFLLSSCATVPITGRKQMKLLPEETMTQMGFASYSEFMDENPVSTNQSAKAQVKRAGENISSAVVKYMKDNGFGKHLDSYRWEFTLVQDKTPNAWCMPGGKVVFYEGILPLTQNENGIAVVMGHEIAHAIAQHGNERMSQGLVTQLGGMALATALQEKPEQTQQIFMLAYGIGSQLGAILPYSRLHEKEADRLGLIFTAMGGYDPREAIKFWERMAAQNKQQIPEWLSTHPLDQTRIEEMKKNMPEALKYYTIATAK
jgi:predicted Zn-dependent protease